MKRPILPVAIALLLFAVLAIPKIKLGLAVWDDKEWMWAKPIFVRLFIDFVFAGIVSIVIWMQLNRNHWLASMTFCLSAILVSVFWITPMNRAPQSFRDHHAWIYELIESKSTDEPQVAIAAAKPPEVSELKSSLEESGPIRLHEEELHVYFKDMIRALYRGDGELILFHGDFSILDYVKAMKTAALEENKETLKERGFTDQMFVLSLRLEYSKQELTVLSTQEAYFHAISRLLLSLGPASVNRIDFVDIADDGQSATAEMIVDSVIPDEPVTFILKNGVWKMSLLPLIPARDDILIQSAFSRGISVEELILGFISDQSGKTPTDEIWDIPK